MLDNGRRAECDIFKAGEIGVPAAAQQAQALQPGRVTAPPPRQAPEMVQAPKVRPEEMHLREPAPEPVPDPRLQAAEAARMAEDREAFKNDRCWYYKDPTGKTQGPFQTTQMEHWAQAGYFAQDLPIRFRNNDFQPLQKLYPPPTEAFSTLPVVASPQPPPAPQAAQAAAAQAFEKAQAEALAKAAALREAQAREEAVRQAAAQAQAQQLRLQQAEAAAARQRQMQLLADPTMAASGYNQYYELMRLQQAQVAAAQAAQAAQAQAAQAQAAAVAQHQQQAALVQAQAQAQAAALARQRQLLGAAAGFDEARMTQEYLTRMQAAQLLQQASAQTAPKATPTPAPTPAAAESRLGPPPTGPAPVPPKPAPEARIGAQPTQPAPAKPGPADRRPNELLAAPPDAPVPPKEPALELLETPSEPPSMPAKAPAPQISAESVLKQLEAKAKPAPPKQPAKRTEEDKGQGRAPAKAQAPLAPPPSAAPDVKPGPPHRKNSDDSPAAPLPQIQSSKEFPTLGGTAEEVVMAPSETATATGGFWERPMRPVKVPNASDFPEPGPSPKAAKAKATPSKAAPSKKDDEKSVQRREQAKELLTQHGLPLEDPLVGFLLSVGTSTEVHDYLQAYYEADADTARRFTEAFVEKGLIAEKPAKEAAGAGGRKKRVKGKEVDPSMLGFTAVPRGQ
ncbi:gigyf2 [Symbiodinium sp. CCMP2592]|nr:gigyf2 [Symbiodinium sp. CCMP2592]